MSSVNPNVPETGRATTQSVRDNFEVIRQEITALEQADTDLADATDTTKGDALVAVKLEATGSVARTQHDKNAEIVSITDFKNDDDTQVDTALADNTTGIQAAIDWMSSEGGGWVMVPPGVFSCRAIAMKDNVTLVLMGWLKNLAVTGSGQVVLHLGIYGVNGNAVENAHVVGMGGGVDGNYDAAGLGFNASLQQSHCVAVTKSAVNCSVSGIHTRNSAGDGIYLAEGSGSAAVATCPTRIRITGNDCENHARQDIAVIHGIDVTVSNNVCEGSLNFEGETPVGGQSRITGTGNIAATVSIKTMQGLDSRMVFTGNTVTDDTTVFTSQGVTFSGNAVGGILRFSDVKDFSITGNYIKMLALTPTVSTFLEDGTVTGNTIIDDDLGDDPRVVYDGTAGNQGAVQIYRTKNVVVAGNYIRGDSMHGIKVVSTCTNLTIRDNEIIDLTATATSNNDGISIVTTGCADVHVTNNRTSGYYNGILASGSGATGGSVSGNAVSGRLRNMDLRNWTDLIVRNNTLAGDILSNFQSLTNPVFEHNYQTNTIFVTNMITFTSCTAPVIRNMRFKVASGAAGVLMLVTNSPNAIVEDHDLHNLLVGYSGTTTIRQRNNAISIASELEDDFLGDVLASNWNGMAGSDPQAVAPAISTAAGGVCRLVVGDDAGATMALNGSQLDSALNWFAVQQGLAMEVRLKLSAITSIAAFVGFTDQVGALEMPFTLAASDVLTANTTDGVGFLFDTAADTDRIWLVGVANGTPATKQDSNVAYVAGTYIVLRVELTNAGAAIFKINGAVVGTTMSGAVTAATAQTPVIAGFSRTTATRNIDVDYIRVTMRRPS